MKDNNEKTKEYIEYKCFECLVEQGLENTTTRRFGSVTGLSNSSLYYWFKDKDDIVLSSTIYGFNAIIDNILTDAYTYLNDPDALLEMLPTSILNHRTQLRLVYQVLMSPQYGDKLREIHASLPLAYNSFAKVLADRTGCDYKELKPLVQLFISTMTNYILWEDAIKMNSQLSVIKTLVKNLGTDH